MFSSNTFIVSGHMLRDLICFERVFVHGQQQLPCFHVGFHDRSFSKGISVHSRLVSANADWGFLTAFDGSLHELRMQGFLAGSLPPCCKTTPSLGLPLLVLSGSGNSVAAYLDN